jgi:2'-5' RNA ligase
MRNSIRSVLLRVPAADPLVDRFRLAGDWSRRLGVPAHITLAGPFPCSQALPMPLLAALAQRAAGIRFELAEVGRVGDATCLLVADERPLTRLRSELLDALGAAPRSEAALPLHLTIARGDSAAAEVALRQALEPHLPLACEVGEIAVAALCDGKLDLQPIGSASSTMIPSGPRT